jgi:hypothetical protein
VHVVVAIGRIDGRRDLARHRQVDRIHALGSIQRDRRDAAGHRVREGPVGHAFPLASGLF